MTESTRPPATDNIELERLVPYLVFRISRRLNANVSTQMRDEGVTIHRWRVLSVLADKGPCSLSEVARITVLGQSVSSRVADQMVRDDLVRRTVSGVDRRATTLSLTPRGKALFDRLWPLYSEHGRRAVESLSENEQRTLVRLLRKVLDGMDSEAAP